MKRDQHCLIYGAAGGIGAAIAARLHQQGWSLHLAGRTAEPLEQMAKTYQAGISVGDAADPAWFAQVSADVDRPITGLVYAIGSINLKPFKRLTPADFQQDFTINALGAAYAAQSALPLLDRKQGASILFFSSIAATSGLPMHASMGMAKGAVHGLTVALAAELAPQVRVNAIAPSLTETSLAKPILGSSALKQALGKQHPLQRLGTPDDMAAMAVTLLSHDAAWITGQVLAIDGGRSTLLGKH